MFKNPVNILNLLSSVIAWKFCDFLAFVLAKIIQFRSVFCCKKLSEDDSKLIRFTRVKKVIVGGKLHELFVVQIFFRKKFLILYDVILPFLIKFSRYVCLKDSRENLENVVST